MLSFNSLGNLGRLGNQMFQYASLKGIAINRGYEFCIPPKEVFGTRDGMVSKDLNIYDLFDLESKNKTSLIRNQPFPERTFTFDEDLFNNCPDNVDLFGYYQTEKYFKHIEQEIKQDFSFDKELLEDCKLFISPYGSSISLHIRRGDYLTNPNHPVQSLEYYQQALKILPDNLPVFVFSDDCSWCFQQQVFQDERFMIAQNSALDVDLCLMTLCDYHVIANSSLSWWGAWLANSKKVIAPKNWFGGQLAIQKPVTDLVFGNWEWI